MKRLVILAMFVATPAAAQQQQSAPSTAADRLAVTLGQCVGRVEGFADQINGLQGELAAAKARVKELEAAQVPPAVSAGKK